MCAVQYIIFRPHGTMRMQCNYSFRHSRMQGWAEILSGICQVHSEFTEACMPAPQFTHDDPEHTLRPDRAWALPTANPSSKLVTSLSRTGENGMKFKGRWDDHPYEPHSLTERVSIVVATVVAILRVLFGAATRAKNKPAI
jgi:hypothetical protein